MLPSLTNLASEAHGDCYFDGNASMLTLHGVAQYFYRERYGLEIDGEYDGESFLEPKGVGISIPLFLLYGV